MEQYLIGDDFVKELDDKMCKKLEKKRYLHTISVAYTAANMAMVHGVNLHKAYIAGLLHDNAKCIPTEKKIALCKKYKLSVSEAELANPELLHAKLGACLAKEKYGIDDEEILAAIASHTTGHPDMTMLEKIIYIADYIEPRRKPLQNMELIRCYAFTDIDRALRIILENTLQYLEKKGATMDPLTLDTYQFYQSNKEVLHDS